MKIFGGLGFRYLVISGSALVIDYVTAWSLAELGLWLPFATSFGYLVGLFVVFPFMRSFVFRSNGPSTKKLWLYLFSGALGVLITYTISYIMSELLAQGFHSAKLLAAGLSFLSVFVYRRFVVFRKSGGYPL